MIEGSDLKGPLEDITVLDVSQFLSGPYCTTMLGDMGAEIIKVEPQVGEALRLYTYINPSMRSILSLLHRNKKGITLNMRTPEGQEIIKKLVVKVDVLVENFTPGTMEKFGLGYDVLKKINPRLIYTAISGFGRTGPYSRKTAFDMIAQAMGGIMHAIQQEDSPPRLFIADTLGGIFGALGTLIALHHRERTGKGQLVDISMQDIMFALNIKAMLQDYITEDRLEKLGKESLLDIRLPLYNSYKTKDGHIAIVALTDRQWRRMCEIMGEPELKRDRRFINGFKRMKNIDDLDALVEDWTQSLTTDEIFDILDEHKIPCGKVLNFEQVRNDPQILARNMVEELQSEKFGTIKVPGVLIKLSESPGSIRTPAPELGEHNKEILKNLCGFSDEKIAELKKKGII